MLIQRGIAFMTSLEVIIIRKKKMYIDYAQLHMDTEYMKIQETELIISSHLKTSKRR